MSSLLYSMCRDFDATCQMRQVRIYSKYKTCTRGKETYNIKELSYHYRVNMHVYSGSERKLVQFRSVKLYETQVYCPGQIQP